MHYILSCGLNFGFYFYWIGFGRSENGRNLQLTALFSNENMQNARGETGKGGHGIITCPPVNHPESRKCTCVRSHVFVVLRCHTSYSLSAVESTCFHGMERYGTHTFKFIKQTNKQTNKQKHKVEAIPFIFSAECTIGMV